MTAANEAHADRELRLATRICIDRGLGVPALVRRGSTALFDTGEAIVRVGPLGEWASSSAGLAQLLGASGIRVPGVRATVDDPASGLSAVVLDRVAASGPVDWAAVGDLVARTHRLAPAAVAGVCGMPSCTAFAHWRFAQMLDQVASELDDADRRVMSTAVESVADWSASALGMPQVVCHGDVHPGNVIASAGQMWLIDWDMICTGPAAWDHAALITWEERWGGQPGLYAAFADGYGADLRGDPTAMLLARGRLLAATLMRLAAGRTDAAAAAEARRRLEYWRGDRDARTWRAM